VFLQESFKL